MPIEPDETRSMRAERCTVLMPEIVHKRSCNTPGNAKMKSTQVRQISAILLTVAIGAIQVAQTIHCQIRQAPQAHTEESVQQAARSGTPADDSYVIGEDDVLGINVWNEPDLKQSVPVRPDGKISLPLVGDVQAAGRTPSQLQDEISAKLTAYITHPNVSVVVQQIKSKKFNVLGRVMKPGAYTLSASTTVLDAIALAGGFQDFAKQKDIYVLRADSKGGEARIPFNYKDVIKGKHREQNIAVEPNDTIVVP